MAFLWLILLLGGLLAPQKGFAYPDFISYGYATCITCHYNGQGNGPLNDYGRALFTTEIASRAIFSNKLSEEQIAAKSGFLGSTQLPWWIRPGVKYRGLYLQTNPGSQASIKKYITMQADLNVAIQFDQKAKFLVVASGGYMPTPASQQGGAKDPKDKNMVSREHYLRWQMDKKFFTYLGLMDKAFGLRIADHTAFSRDKTGLGMNDQTHGAMFQYYGNKSEYTAHLFVGNLQQDAPIRQKGGSFMAEYDLAEKNRVGFGFLTSKNDILQATRYEVHSKLGLDKGNSLLTEFGVIQNKPSVEGKQAKTGGYLLMEGIYMIKRGHNLYSQIEYYNETLTPVSPDVTRWSFGFLSFPMPRMEFRAGFTNDRSISDTSVGKDRWTLQTQLHLSL